MMPKRLIEVDLPIARISGYARREKAIRHGHLSTLHLWWARRPLASSRAVILASLLPDPADPACPPEFQERAAALLLRLRDERGGPRLDWSNPIVLRDALLTFIADFADFAASDDPLLISTSRALVTAAHRSLVPDGSTQPFVADPFAGGGAIPLEVLRVGGLAFASDLNPVAVLLNKVALEYMPRFGQRLVDELRVRGAQVASVASSELGRLYPGVGGSPLSYLWARTVLSEEPTSLPPIEIPLMRSFWLARGARRRIALRWVRAAGGAVEIETIERRSADGTTRLVRRPILEVFEPDEGRELDRPTAVRGSAICPVSGHVTPVERVREQLRSRRAGSADARLLCVVETRHGVAGRRYRLAGAIDFQAVDTAAALADELQRLGADGLSPLPDEDMDLNEIRRNSTLIYGARRWGDLFTPRQAVALATIARAIRDVGAEMRRSGDSDLATAVEACLALSLSKEADLTNALVAWKPDAECPVHMFTRQAIPMVWDFAEAVPVSEGSGSWGSMVERTADALESLAGSGREVGTVIQASATAIPLPTDSVDAVVTDPPYYDAVPYANLSDFFYVWLRRSLVRSLPDLFSGQLTPKSDEIVVDRAHHLSSQTKNVAHYERELTKAFAECRRILKPGGVAAVIFASKSTASWEALLGALVESGWVITASWSIDTEMDTRVSAQGQARLGSSIHLVCRPREHPDGTLVEDSVGEWRDVVYELGQRIHDWMPRLSAEGVVGADAIFACIGPALEVFSRWSRVEKPSGDRVLLQEYLEQVWAAIAKEALAQVFADADSAGLEADARLTAMWLWTIRTSRTGEIGLETGEDDEEATADEPSARLVGFALEYDAARKIAQGLGVDLQALPDLVEIKAGVARLLGVRERAGALFGGAYDERNAKPRGASGQLSLFADGPEPGVDGIAPVIGDLQPAVTALDRVHQAMLLFGSGRSDQLMGYLSAGVGTDRRFWNIAQSLAALYPSGSDEKRWVDGVLARKKSFGY